MTTSDFIGIVGVAKRASALSSASSTLAPDLDGPIARIQKAAKRAKDEGDLSHQASSVRDFFATFPNDEACLKRVMEVRHGLRHVCGKCQKKASFHKIDGRRAYACANCGDHLYPCVNTIFEDSRTPLQTWFYAIYLFVATRHGVSGKELQRTLGVTYKCAWRISHQIRSLKADADGYEMLRGLVELDEAYSGQAPLRQAWSRRGWEDHRHEHCGVRRKNCGSNHSEREAGHPSRRCSR